MNTQVPSAENGSRRRFSAQEKLRILAEWERSGNGAAVARKYGVRPITLYRWKKRMEAGAQEWLRGSRRKKEEALRELERENRELKDTVAALSHELMLLKKKMHLV